MNVHPLVLQLRFTRAEFQRGLEGITDAEARRRFLPMNCMSWIVGHLAFQEQRYWLNRAQGKPGVVPDLEKIIGLGQSASTPPLAEMWQDWHVVMAAVDPWLDSLTTDALSTHMLIDGKPHVESIGSMLRRVTYHYWYHLGEAQAIRQLLGHTDLPEFVGDIHQQAPYIPESPQES